MPRTTKSCPEMNNILYIFFLLYITVSSVISVKPGTEDSDNFKPLPLPQTKSQKLIKELSAKVNAKQSDSKKQQQDFNMISLGTHETQAPSSMSSFYDMMSRKPGDSKEQKNNERNQRQTSSFQNFVDSQPQMYSQQLGVGGLRDVSGGGGGAGRPSQTTEFNTPLIFASGNNLQVSNPVDGPQMFDQTMTAAPAASPTGQGTIEGFYVNNMGTQPMLQEPSMAQELGPNSLPMANQLAMQGQYAPQQEQQQQRQQQTNQFGPSANYYSQQLIQQPVSPYEVDKQAAYYLGLVHPNQQQHNKQIGKRIKPASTNRGKKKEMLSNEQLVSLIDELKEFNNRQTSKMSKGGKNQLKEFAKPTGGTNSDNERLFTEIVKSINKSKPSLGTVSEDAKDNTDDEESDDDNQSSKGGDSDNRRSEDDDGDVSSEDLAKLAKRLVAGKRAKVSQSKRRTSSAARENDDFEDIKDALMDDKKTTRKHNKKEKDPISHLKDKQQAEVDSRLENIIQEVANRKRKMNKKRKEKEEDKEQSNVKQDDEGDYADKARRRRDNLGAGVESGQLASNKAVRTITAESRRSQQNQKSKKINRSIPEKGHRNNLPKALIEMTTDKKDGQESSAETNSMSNQPQHLVDSKSTPPLQSNFQPDKMVRRSDEAMGNDSVINSYDNGGEEKLKYPKKERNNDHESLKRSLVKARAAKSKLSSRIPVPMEKIVKKALSGEMEKLVEVTPDTELQPTGDGGAAISLKPPNIVDADESDNQSSDEGINKSDMIPAQVEPGRGLEAKSVNQNEKQLSDEYPISDQVSDRLNKLSNNLDRYFNDGFLQEIEQKSQPDGGDRKQGAASHQHLQLATNTNGDGKENEKLNVMKKDHDFDIDVAIDGKRDIPDSDDEDAITEITEEPETIKRRARNGKGAKGERQNAKKRDRRSKANAKGSTIGKKKVISPQKLKPPKINDPVENETLDSPIGPDGDDFPELGSAKRTKGSKEKQTNYGRKLADKFYQEPD